MDLELFMACRKLWVFKTVTNLQYWIPAKKPLKLVTDWVARVNNRRSLNLKLGRFDQEMGGAYKEVGGVHLTRRGGA